MFAANDNCPAGLVFDREAVTMLCTTLERIWDSRREFGIVIPTHRVEVARLAMARWIVREVAAGTTDMQAVVVARLRRLSQSDLMCVDETAIGAGS